MHIVQNFFFVSFTFIAMLSAKEHVVTIDIPAIPKIPDVKSITIPSVKLIHQQEKKTTTVHTPFVTEEEKKLSGDVEDGYITPYLVGKYQREQDLTNQLKNNGFIVITTKKIADQNKTVIVFTTKELLENSTRGVCAFSAVLHVTLDAKDNTMKITNPKYFLKAFSLNRYDAQLADELLEHLHNTFQKLHASHSKVQFARLSTYRFEDAMPRYLDMQLVAEGKNELLTKILQQSTKLIYLIKIDQERYLAGVELSYTMYPYEILIENNQAKILDYRYFTAIMNPGLPRDEFLRLVQKHEMVKEECATMIENFQ